MSHGVAAYVDGIGAVAEVGYGECEGAGGEGIFAEFGTDTRDIDVGPVAYEAGRGLGRAVARAGEKPNVV